MNYFIFLLLLSALLPGCQENKNRVPGKPVATYNTAENKKFIQVPRKVVNNIPSIGISNYTLITDDLSMDSANADALLRTKIIVPLAMQKHDGKLFDSILSKDFTAQGGNEFLERAAFIKNRVSGKWMISEVKYEDMVLQFFGEIALLTYRNTVKEVDEKGVPQTWHFTWADIWVKEDGRWKIKVSRGIHGNEN